MNNGSYCVAVELRKPHLYFEVWEGAKLLGGKRLDCQTFDEIGWWMRSIVLEFEIQSEIFTKFESELKKAYGDQIIINIIRAALPTR